MQQKEIEKNLETFGLNDIESTIYLHLLNTPPQTILSISRTLDIPRTSIYDNAQRLIEKGLVERIVEHKSQRLKARSLDMLQTIIDEEKDRITSLESVLDELKKNIVIATDPTTATEVRYYQGKEGLQQMMWNSLKAKKEIVGYSVFGRVDIVGISFQKRYTEEFKLAQLVDRVISNPEDEIVDLINKDVHPAKHQIELTNIKMLEREKLYITGDTMIYNDTFAVSYWKHGEVVGVEIDNTEFVRSQKSIFNLLWDIAQPL
ncbi:hypothetical protein KC571_02590 [candidate division WWE3 bacterium]|uniref:Transcription regulator TrmB N-terminal domain-containing protein n=1 Tax=candidate division WWE3 bacterium TaxID=2053526 RepID=A0A955LH37_UNCKA|nr:hypothetical protein [candidate division WWE3 bacterium]